MAKYNKKNEEILDKTPVELPLGYNRPQTLDEKIAQAIRQNEFNKLNQELETFEEADDFDIEDEEDLDFTGQYDVREMEPEFEKIPMDPPEPKSAKKEAGSEDASPQEAEPPQAEQKQQHSDT